MNLAPIDPLGFGASADVWLAEDLDLKRQVAVKYFNEPDPSLHRKVALEHAKALARVQHPNVVTVLSIEPQLLSLTQFQRGGFVIIRDRWMRISRITSHGSALESGDGKRNGPHMGGPLPWG